MYTRCRAQAGSCWLINKCSLRGWMGGVCGPWVGRGWWLGGVCGPWVGRGWWLAGVGDGLRGGGESGWAVQGMCGELGSGSRVVKGKTRWKGDRVEVSQLRGGGWWVGWVDVIRVSFTYQSETGRFTTELIPMNANSNLTVPKSQGVMGTGGLCERSELNGCLIGGWLRIQDHQRLVPEVTVPCSQKSPGRLRGTSAPCSGKAEFHSPRAERILLTRRLPQHQEWAAGGSGVT